jgi:hypothetical protein
MGAVQAWIAALVTIGLWSWLYNHQSPIFEMVQYLYIGLSFAYSISLEYSNYVRPTFAHIVAGQWTLVIPIVIALLMYMRYFKATDYLSRWALSFFVGYGAGYVLAFQPAVFLGQIAGSFYQLWGASGAVVARNWISLVLLLASLLYFFFTVRRQQPVVKYGGRFGRYAIMAAFGATFGSQILFRYTLLFGRFYFLFHNWLHVV